MCLWSVDPKSIRTPTPQAHNRGGGFPSVGSTLATKFKSPVAVHPTPRGRNAGGPAKRPPAQFLERFFRVMRYLATVEQVNDCIGYARLSDGRRVWFAARDFNQQSEFARRVRTGVRIYCTLMDRRGFLVGKSISLAD